MSLVSIDQPIGPDAILYKIDTNGHYALLFVDNKMLKDGGLVDNSKILSLTQSDKFDKWKQYGYDPINDATDIAPDVKILLTQALDNNRLYKVVTNAGGHSTGISAAAQASGVEFKSIIEETKGAAWKKASSEAWGFFEVWNDRIKSTEGKAVAAKLASSGVKVAGRALIGLELAIYINVAIDWHQKHPSATTDDAVLYASNEAAKDYLGISMALDVSDWVDNGLSNWELNLPWVRDLLKMENEDPSNPDGTQ